MIDQNIKDLCRKLRPSDWAKSGFTLAGVHYF